MHIDIRLTGKHISLVPAYPCTPPGSARAELRHIFENAHLSLLLITKQRYFVLLTLSKID